MTVDLKHQLTQHHWESGCSVAGVEGTRQAHQITGEKVLVGLGTGKLGHGQCLGRLLVALEGKGRQLKKLALNSFLMKLEVVGRHINNLHEGW